MQVTSADIVPEIPYLRRHARLLTGSKEVGDEYVRLCLELVMAEPDRLQDGDVRMQLFHAFHSVWSVINPPEAERATNEITTHEERLEQGLAALAPTERRVLLLIAVEDFSYEAVGKILDLDAAAVRRHFTKARRELDEQVTCTVLIIEDEPLIAMELCRIVQEMGLTVAGTTSRQDDAIEAVEENRPGLVLADIQLQDNGSGIAAAHSILQQLNVPIVFVTGYPERLLSGEGFEPAFVVTKPFREDALKATIAQALSIYAAPSRALEHRERMLAKLRQITAAEMRVQRGKSA
jgi:CheY-like chemotaxis protein/DNA-directed RNA polymerase specialized sigma24 family protein